MGNKNCIESTRKPFPPPSDKYSYDEYIHHCMEFGKYLGMIDFAKKFTPEKTELIDYFRTIAQISYDKVQNNDLGKSVAIDIDPQIEIVIEDKEDDTLVTKELDLSDQEIPSSEIIPASFNHSIMNVDNSGVLTSSMDFSYGNIV